MNLGLLVVCCTFCIGIGLGASPDDNRNVTEIIKARGYPVEDHYTITSDGFVLSLQRITGPRDSSGTPQVSKPVVLLQHGLLDNSFTWVSQEVVSESLGFILADQGYDVWLSNVRGNTYSNRNTYLKPTDAAFWEWSFDEMAHIDLPAFLNYILTITGTAKLSYIGHSQGTTMGFIGYEDQAIASKVNIFIALAPVAWVHHSTSKLLDALAYLDATVIVQLLGVKDFAPDDEVLKILLPDLCSKSPDECANILGLAMGWDTTNLNGTRLPVIMAHEPSGTSTQNIIHWSQEIKAEAFQAYDYGSPDENKKHYNTTTPPQYDPSLISIPTAIFYGGNDSLADPTDVQTLVPLLQNLVYTHYEPSYAHLDFVWGENAYIRIYPAVLQLLEKYSSV